MKIVGIIPVRLGSSRFPNKPLAPILGVPMVGHVYLRSKMCPLLEEVYVATCDQEIADYTESIGGKAVMTAATHERASDRVAEAAAKIERETGGKLEIVVLIQGDEPMLVPQMIEESARPIIEDPTILVTNLMGKLNDAEEHKDVNEVKVVTDQNNFALYFSREPIPSAWKTRVQLPMWKQVCIISFRRHFLQTFCELPPTPLEQFESVDMLRVLEHGYRVKMVPTATTVYSVDTEEDRREVEELMKNDRLVREYAKNYS
jgi:3-deoxy-manno-octulosonate cytidylyltransferase (CMP-KDO synthetase)